MSAALTTELLAAISPPAGEVGEQMAVEFDRMIQTAVGRCNASDARLVALARRALLEGWWRHRGCHSPEHWVAAQLGLDWPRARRIIRIARELGAYPKTAAHFAAGLLTEAHVYEIITRVDPAREAEVAASAGSWNIGQLRRWSANFPKPAEDLDTPLDDTPGDEPPADDSTSDADSAQPDPFDLPPPDPTPSRTEAERWWGRWNDQGRYIGGFDVGVEVGALLEKTLQAGRAKVFAERTGIDPDDDDHAGGAARITWAVALERVLYAALAGLDPATAAEQRPGDRYQVLVHLDAEHPERSRIHLGPLLTKAQRQHLTCDADLKALLWRDRRPVDAGRRRRTVDPLLRALVEDRDRGCVVCGAQGFLHIHHEIHWEDGGPTDIENLSGYCPCDHKRIHAGEIKILRDPLDPRARILLDRHGRPLPRPGPIPPDRPPPAPNPYAGPIRSRTPSTRAGYTIRSTRRPYAA